MEDYLLVALPSANAARAMSAHSDLLHEERSLIQEGIKAAIRYGLYGSTIRLEYNANSDVVKKLVAWVSQYGYAVRVQWDRPEDNHCYLIIRW